VAFAKLALLLSCATAYGYHRDELYELARTRHLAWGFVDGPPASVALLLATSKLYGETLLSMRVLPAIVGTIVVILTARLARTFGAGVLAQGLAALCVVVAPGLLTVDHVDSMRSIEVLAWTVTAGLVARALTEPEDRATRPWALAGIAAGVGLLDTIESAVFLVGLAAGLALGPGRAKLRTRDPWIALGVALVVVSPYLAWENAHGWPVREAVARALRGGLGRVSPLGFAWGQVEQMLPTNAIVWIAGLGALLVSKRFAAYRALGVAFVVAFAVLALTPGDHGVALAPGYTVLFAAGAAALEPWLTPRRWTSVVLALALLVSGAAVAPFAIPVVSVGRFQRYARMLHVTPGRGDGDGAAALPRQFADMYGWPELARTVSMVFEALPLQDRAEAVVLASNAGRAGAIDLFGPAVGLPLAISGSSAYWSWGTAGASGKVVIAVGGDEALLRAHFTSVELVTVFGHSLAAPQERHVRIYVCRDSVAPLDAMWPELRTYE
jgi:hypothetical protein